MIVAVAGVVNPLARQILQPLQGTRSKHGLSASRIPTTLSYSQQATLGPITLAYETYGELNEDKSNAVLIVHALSGDAHAAGQHAPEDRKPGWWDAMVGPGRPRRRTGEARTVKTVSPARAAP